MILPIKAGYNMTMNNYYETTPTTGCNSCLSHTASSFAGGKKKTTTKKTTKKTPTKAPKKTPKKK